MTDINITLHELKRRQITATESSLPSFKQLMNRNPVMITQTVVRKAVLTTYENGYALYESDGAYTIMNINHCGNYRYEFLDGTQEIIPAEVFEKEDWRIRLIMEGEQRIEHNRTNTSKRYETVSLEGDGSDWSAFTTVDFLPEDSAEFLSNLELERLYTAMKQLTKRQLEVVQMYFYKEMTQTKIAQELGISQRSVAYSLSAALKKLKKFF